MKCEDVVAGRYNTLAELNRSIETPFGVLIVSSLLDISINNVAYDTTDKVLLNNHWRPKTIATLSEVSEKDLQHAVWLLQEDEGGDEAYWGGVAIYQGKVVWINAATENGAIYELIAQH
jgi:hypothetical protein